MQPLFRTAGIRAIEQAHGTAGLMEKAGMATAVLARELLPEEACSVLVVAGHGNNGGDALVAARHLKEAWLQVDVVFMGEVAKLPPDAAQAHARWLEAGGTLLDAIPEKRYALVIDGLFGIGLSKPLQSQALDLVRRINTLDALVLAIDIPSGLDADSGRVLGEAVVADHTLTFLGLKPGLFTLEGVDHAGLVHACDLGVETQQPPDGWLVDACPALPAQRQRNSHKGTFGSFGILGGDHGMVGAPLLAARAALLIGAGRVYVGLLAEHPPMVDTFQPELMLRNARDVLDLPHLTALVVGPGMGRSNHAASVLQRALRYPAPLVLDADALALLAEQADLRKLLAERTHATLLTPHPGEAATLLACSTAELQSDRIAHAHAIAETYWAITLLKGAGTVIAQPDGPWTINATGNPGLAAAGMGDTLAGMIGGLAAQGMAMDDAARLGAWLHGAAADALVAEGTGPIGLTASEIALKSRELLNHLVTQDHA